MELAAYGLAKNSASLDYLLQTAQSSDHAQKIWALWALGLMANRGVQSERVVNFLIAHLQDSDADARRWVVEGLALSGSDQAMDTILKVMHDDASPMVRERAACSLAESGMFSQQQRASAIPGLLAYTDDPSLDAQTHAWAFQALGILRTGGCRMIRRLGGSCTRGSKIGSRRVTDIPASGNCGRKAGTRSLCMASALRTIATIADDAGPLRLPAPASTDSTHSDILATWTSKPVLGSRDVSEKALNPSPVISVWRKMPGSLSIISLRPSMSARKPCALSGRDFHLLRAGDDRFRSVGTDEFRPVFRKQVTAGEDIGPDDFPVDGDNHAYSIAIAQLPDQGLVTLLDRLRDSVHLFSDFCVFVDLGVGTGLRHLSRDHWRSGGDFDGHSLFLSVHFVPDFALILIAHRFGADGRLRHQRAAHRRVGGRRSCAVIGVGVPRGSELFAGRDPAAGLDAENAQVNGVTFRRDDSVFADHTILLASGHDLAGQKEERPPGIVDEYKAVYFSAIVMNGGRPVCRRIIPVHCRLR